MPTDRYAKAVRIIEVDMLDCASLAVAHDDGPAYKLLLGGMQFAEDVEGSFLDTGGPVHADETTTDSRRTPTRNKLPNSGGLEHDREKCEAVFRKDHAQSVT